MSPHGFYFASFNFLDLESCNFLVLEVDVWEYTRVILLKLQLSKSRNGCLEVPEVKRAKEVTYKTQFSIPCYVDFQLLTISRGEVFVIPFGRKR